MVPSVAIASGRKKTTKTTKGSRKRSVVIMIVMRMITNLKRKRTARNVVNVSVKRRMNRKRSMSTAITAMVMNKVYLDKRFAVII